MCAHIVLLSLFLIIYIYLKIIYLSLNIFNNKGDEYIAFNVTKYFAFKLALIKIDWRKALEMNKNIFNFHFNK